MGCSLSWFVLSLPNIGKRQTNRVQSLANPEEPSPILCSLFSILYRLSPILIRRIPISRRRSAVLIRHFPIPIRAFSIPGKVCTIPISLSTVPASLFAISCKAFPISPRASALLPPLSAGSFWASTVSFRVCAVPFELFPLLRVLHPELVWGCIGKSRALAALLRAATPEVHGSARPLRLAGRSETSVIFC